MPGRLHNDVVRVNKALHELWLSIEQVVRRYGVVKVIPETGMDNLIVFHIHDGGSMDNPADWKRYTWELFSMEYSPEQATEDDMHSKFVVTIRREATQEEVLGTWIYEKLRGHDFFVNWSIAESMLELVELFLDQVEAAEINGFTLEEAMGISKITQLSGDKVYAQVELIAQGWVSFKEKWYHKEYIKDTDYEMGHAYIMSHNGFANIVKN